jgi:ribosomal protein S12 methylthiotransferase
VGSEVVCLIDSVDEEGTGYGRYYGQAPEIDSICLVSGGTAQPGQHVKVRVVGTQDYDLVVEQI